MVNTSVSIINYVLNLCYEITCHPIKSLSSLETTTYNHQVHDDELGFDRLDDDVHWNGFDDDDLLDDYDEDPQDDCDEWHANGELDDCDDD